jgi:hypothetical protein
LDIHVYWNILKMHGPINVKSPNNTSKWQMGFNSAFKGLIHKLVGILDTVYILQNFMFTEGYVPFPHLPLHQYVGMCYIYICGDM